MSWQIPRYQNERDINVFKTLAEDIESGENKYQSTDNLIKLYEQTTGKKHLYINITFYEKMSLVQQYLLICIRMVLDLYIMIVNKLER